MVPHFERLFWLRSGWKERVVSAVLQPPMSHLQSSNARQASLDTTATWIHISSCFQGCCPKLITLQKMNNSSLVFTSFSLSLWAPKLTITTLGMRFLLHPSGQYHINKQFMSIWSMCYNMQFFSTSEKLMGQSQVDGVQIPLSLWNQGWPRGHVKNLCFIPLNSRSS